MTDRIVVNGKFLGAPLNGVHRTAALFTAGLARQAEAAGVDLRLVTPHQTSVGDAPDPTLSAVPTKLAPGWFGTGQGWEMLTLPRLARGALLVNFCNLAPVLHGNAVVMIHDAQTLLCPEDYTGRQAAAYRALLPLIARRARHILTVSSFARDSLLAHGIGREGKISVVHNDTDHILHQPADPTVLARHGLQAGSYALALGSAKGYKNLTRVFQALSPPAPAGLRLVVAGGPPASAYTARGWTPPGDALFTGFVTDAELRALYQGAAVFLFPSLTEGFGLPPVEAMQCGAPVIASDAGAMPEICGPAARLVPPDDTAAWRAAILDLARNAEMRDAQVARGRARARGLGWDAAAARLWDVLQPLFAASGGGGARQ